MAQFDWLAVDTALNEAVRLNIQETLFINCSPAHMYDTRAAVDDYADRCDSLGIDPGRVVFEIIETEQIEPAHICHFISACHEHGFRVALDDLGSGYSWLEMLGQLRPDVIKLGRKLTAGVKGDPFRAVIVNRLLDAVRILGIPTVVEGIESRADADWAVANGATYLQGYLFGRPA